jgi:hypothetical protein
MVGNELELKSNVNRALRDQCIVVLSVRCPPSDTSIIGREMRRGETSPDNCSSTQMCRCIFTSLKNDKWTVNILTSLGNSTTDRYCQQSIAGVDDSLIEIDSVVESVPPRITGRRWAVVFGEIVRDRYWWFIRECIGLVLSQFDWFSLC